MSNKLTHSFAAHAKGAPGEVVQTTAGKVRGLVQNGVHAFKGVPYGASPAGAGRFLPPAKPQPWTNVREAFELGPRATQLDSQFRGVVPP